MKLEFLIFNLIFILKINLQNTANANTTQINALISHLDQEIVGSYSVLSKKILESKTINKTGKKILLTYLIIRLMRMRQRLIEMTEVEMGITGKKKMGNYMHWRHG
jgi:hypothetical protein